MEKDTLKIIADLISEIKKNQEDLRDRVMDSKTKFEVHLKSDEMMYEKIDNQLDSMNSILRENTDSLNLHMRRTEIGETKLEIFEEQQKEVTEILSKMSDRLSKLEEPVKLREAFKKYILGIFVAISAIAGAIKVVVELIKKQ